MRLRAGRARLREVEGALEIEEGAEPARRRAAAAAHAYAVGDAFAYTRRPDPSAHAHDVVRGQRGRWAHHDPRPCLIPPDWSGGYTSIFAAEAGEERPAAE